MGICTKLILKESNSETDKLYFISTKKNIKKLEPRIPDNFFTRKRYEDDKIARVCFFN